MTDQEILSRLTRILRELLSDDSIGLTMETRRDEVPNWDSFAYVNFIVAVEMEFAMKFSVAEVESFQNVGAVVRVISAVLPTRLQRARGGAA
jgi:acyl carrier protein